MPDASSPFFGTLEGLYKSLSPKGLYNITSNSSNFNNSDPKSLFLSKINEQTMPINGQFFRYQDIKTELESFYAGIKDKISDDNVKKATKKIIHATSLDGIINFSDEDFWVTPTPAKKGDTEEHKMSNFLQSLLPTLKDQGKQLSVFTVNTTRVNPALRGTEEIDIFLNSIPSIFAAQMVPYLDVEFQLMGLPLDVERNNLSSPSMLRFLMGGGSGIAVSDADKAMLETLESGKDSKGSDLKDASFSGLEMFLAPQTLTNMNNLGADGYHRTVPVKPFLPFASIDGFEISYVNAGSGAMVHKKGTLRLKIHDKARLGEISPFIQGGPGFTDATVWTTYGWLAPRQRGEDDQYAKFINENMLLHEAWTVQNTSFSFDATGQVTLSIELVSKNVSQIQRTKLSSSDEVEKTLRDIQSVLEHVRFVQQQAGDISAFSTDVRVGQVLEGASRGKLPDFKKSGGKLAAINATIAAIKRSPSVSVADAEKLADELKEIVPEDPKMSLYGRLKDSLGKDIKTKIDNIAALNQDPFLPDETRAKEDLYFTARFLKEVKEGVPVSADGYKQKEGTDLPPIVYTGDKKYVSFGTLVTAFIGPALLAQKNCNEVQLYFHKLNDTCGPISGHCLASFPIDVRKFVYTYSEAIMASGKAEMGVEEFIRHIINTQINDNRSVAYGMTRAYKPEDNTKPETVPADGGDGKASYDDVMDAWNQEWGGVFTRPVIEIQVETGHPGAQSEVRGNLLDKYSVSKRDQIRTEKAEATPSIMRVHFYDKQTNPKAAATSVINNGSGWSIVEMDLPTAARQAVYRGGDDTALQQFQKISDAMQSSASPTTPGKPVATAASDNLAMQYLESTATITNVPRAGGRSALQAIIQQNVPTINIGSNSTMVLTANVASKTDGLAGAANIINSSKGKPSNTSQVIGTEESPDQLPLRVVPAQVTLTTMGCPIARMYQQYFIDFNTGTTLDNLYNCNQVQHSLGPGKFTTNWSFLYTDAYGKFFNPPSASLLARNAYDVAKAAKAKSDAAATKKK